MKQQFFKYPYCLKPVHVLGYSNATVPIMTKRRKHQILTSLIATVWLINGLVCKVLNLVPRHQDIVAMILGDDHARLITTLIGISETGMAIWILSGTWTRLNALTQIVVIGTMNILELFLVPDLLLWGNANALFAFLLLLVIYYNEFHINQKSVYQS